MLSFQSNVDVTKIIFVEVAKCSYLTLFLCFFNSSNGKSEPKRPLSSAEKLFEQWRSLDKRYAKYYRALRKKRQELSSRAERERVRDGTVKKLQNEVRTTRSKIQKVFMSLVLGNPQVCVFFFLCVFISDYTKVLTFGSTTVS